MESSNYFEKKYQTLSTQSFNPLQAAELVCHAYLDGKPGNPKLAPTDKNNLFWHAGWLQGQTTTTFTSEPFVLALAKYFSQESVRNPLLLYRIAQLAPESVERAVRYSGIVLKTGSLKWQELADISQDQQGCFDELVAICRFFQQANQDRVLQVKQFREKLEALTPLEMLSYCSLFAFEYLIQPSIIVDGDEVKRDTCWKSLSNILNHSLKNATADTLKVTESRLGRSLKRHMSALIFPTPELTPKALVLYRAFTKLFFAQLELDRFIAQSVHAFCYDDSVRYRFTDRGLDLETVDSDKKSRWKDADNKFLTLQEYWLKRGFEAFKASPMSEMLIGSVENHEANAMAVVSAMGASLELQEIYGIGNTITTNNGLEVDTYQALLSSYLMTAFYKSAYIEPFQNARLRGAGWQEALAALAMNGLAEGMQNRFPLTWSTDKEKAKRILGWTVNEQNPEGDLDAAKAILDFWTTDLWQVANQLNNQPQRPKPNLYERPFFKIGSFSFQAPWVMAFQNNATAAINNLRRIGSQRSDVQSETARIEQRLAEAFQSRGFSVMIGFHPPATPTSNPGEIDLICKLDDQLLVIEVKSSYLRSSAGEIWQYKTQTLRKAGEQAKRKRKAIEKLLLSEPESFADLNIHPTSLLDIHSWIVDTTVEHDHEYFSGALKVSLQEVLIALKDDAHRLIEPPEQLKEHTLDLEWPERSVPHTLYPQGFSAKTFVKIIQADAIWDLVRRFQSQTGSRIFDPA